MKQKFIVELEIPDGADFEDCVQYILDAVSTWRGALRPPLSYGDDDPGDPMFGLDRDSVSVSRIRS